MGRDRSACSSALPALTMNDPNLAGLDWANQCWPCPAWGTFRRLQHPAPTGQPTAWGCRAQPVPSCLPVGKTSGLCTSPGSVGATG